MLCKQQGGIASDQTCDMVEGLRRNRTTVDDINPALPIVRNIYSIVPIVFGP